jgi:hypothetical protein
MIPAQSCHTRACIPFIKNKQMRGSSSPEFEFMSLIHANAIGPLGIHEVIAVLVKDDTDQSLPHICICKTPHGEIYFEYGDDKKRVFRVPETDSVAAYEEFNHIMSTLTVSEKWTALAKAGLYWDPITGLNQTLGSIAAAATVTVNSSYSESYRNGTGLFTSPYGAMNYDIIKHKLYF